MPYIPHDERHKFDYRIYQLAQRIESPGQLNYVISGLLREIMRRAPRVGYSVLNELMGVLESCKQEFYRRVVAPYEDKKIEENGDVY